PNIEKMVELKPDIVIAATHFKKEALEKLETLGIPVIILYDGESFEEVYEVIETMGEIFNRSTEAENIIHNMKQKVKQVMDKVKDQEKPSVYYVVGFGEYGDYTAGGDTFIGKMIEMAGGKNVAKEAEGWAYSLEKLVEQNPDILICSKHFDSKAGIELANGYKELSAVKEGRLYEIDNDLLDRPGTRLADGLEELARLIHPNVFK
ncbi:MAG: ABC transporter substrate-binding protein, partial [Epulopiscium sp.]|nr:ABC transporter substrate-binding protein [Candidatus Epulonipiscium sp.]